MLNTYCEKCIFELEKSCKNCEHYRNNKQKKLAISKQKKGYHFVLLPTKGEDENLEFAKTIIDIANLCSTWSSCRFIPIPIQTYIDNSELTREKWIKVAYGKAEV